jgi:hypothetical protein
MCSSILLRFICNLISDKNYKSKNICRHYLYSLGGISIIKYMNKGQEKDE